MFLERYQDKVKDAYEALNDHTGDIPKIIVRAVQQFSLAYGAEGSASIAYYALFSLFPLLLILAAVLGYVLVRVRYPGEVLDVIVGIFPISRGIIQDNLLEIIQRGAVGGWIGLVGLIWAASGVFTVLARQINRAWPEARQRSLLQGRLIAFLMIIILTVLLLLSVFITVLRSLLPLITPYIPEDFLFFESVLGTLLSSILPWVVIFLVYILLYRWVPNTRVKWREAFWGALFATVAWRLTTFVYTWFVGSELNQYDVLYGTLGRTLALLTWIYLTALITIFGAYLTSSIAHCTRLTNLPYPSKKGVDS